MLWIEEFRIEIDIDNRWLKMVEVMHFWNDVTCKREFKTFRSMYKPLPRAESINKENWG